MQDTSITTRQKIEEALNKVRPYLNADGGDVELVSIEPDFTVNLRLLGACRSCEISHMTMKAGIENALKNAVPEIKGVQAVEN